MKRSLLAILVASTALGLPAGAVASTAPIQAHLVAGPGGFVSVGTYYTPVVVIERGQPISFTNLDVEPHNVVATRKTGRGRHRHPLFASEVIEFGQSAPVSGVTKLRPGSYEFFCGLHPWMRGTIVVSSAGATPREAVGR